MLKNSPFHCSFGRTFDQSKEILLCHAFSGSSATENTKEGNNNTFRNQTVISGKNIEWVSEVIIPCIIASMLPSE